MKSIYRLITFLTFCMLHLSLSANDDIASILSLVLAEEHFVDLIEEHQGKQRDICLITNDLMPTPNGKIDETWQVEMSSSSGSSSTPCINVSSFKQRPNKVVLQFTYGEYKIKAKLRRPEGDLWLRTSFTIRGDGKFIVDKEF